MPRKKGAVTSSAHKAKISAGVKAFNKGSTKKRDGVVSNNEFPRNAAGKKVGGGTGAKNVGAPGSPKSTKKDGNPISQKAMQANVGPNTASNRHGTDKKAILEGKPGGVRTMRSETRPKTPDKTVVTSDSNPESYGGLSTGQKKEYSRSKKTGEVTKKDPAPKSEMPGGKAAGKGTSKQTSAERQRVRTESRKAAGLSTNAATANRQDGRKTTPPRGYAPTGEQGRQMGIDTTNNDRIWTEKKNQQDRIGNVRYGKHGGGYGVKANYGGKNTGAKPGSKNVSNNRSQRHFENKDISPGSKNNPTPQRRNKPKRKRIFRPKGG